VSPMDRYLQEGSRLAEGPIRLSTQANYVIEAGGVSAEFLAGLSPSLLESSAKQSAASGNMVSDLADMRIVWRRLPDGGPVILGFFFRDALDAA
jgi:predicted Rdx family selenoprotein